VGIFGAGSEMFGRADQQWMINFRVRDLDAMVSELRAAQIEVEVDPEDYPNGRFARLADPDGNRARTPEPAGPVSVPSTGFAPEMRVRSRTPA
jgi:predicted enzyme related to lactoylglutathione lyase